LGEKPFNKWHMIIYQHVCPMHQWPWRAYALGFCYCSWRLKIFTLKKVESFWSCFWMLKVFVVSFWMLKVLVHTFGCWTFLLLFFDVTLDCSKFLFLVLNVESSYSYSWILKVFTFVFGRLRLLFLLLDVKRFMILGLLFICIYIYIMM
jgi:hypothetical protein